jgi:hypothetical protein
MMKQASPISQEFMGSTSNLESRMSFTLLVMNSIVDHTNIAWDKARKKSTAILPILP